MTKTLLLLALLGAAANASAGCVTSSPACVAKPAVAASAPSISRQNSALQAACTEKVKPMLKGAERIRDMGSAQGQVEQDVTFRVSANGDKKMKTFVCSVQQDGSLKVVSKG